MTDPVERRDLVERLTKIADASLRADGTDIPLGTELRAAAAEITRLRSLLTPGEGAETTAEERARWSAALERDIKSRTGSAMDLFLAMVLRDLARAEAIANEATAERDEFRGSLATALGKRMVAEAERDAATARAERLAKTLGKTLRWAETRCPCKNEEPNPCPLCGASVENLEGCKSAENTLPRWLLEELRIANRSRPRAGDHGED